MKCLETVESHWKGKGKGPDPAKTDSSAFGLLLPPDSLEGDTQAHWVHRGSVIVQVHAQSSIEEMIL